MFNDSAPVLPVGRRRADPGPLCRAGGAALYEARRQRRPARRTLRHGIRILELHAGFGQRIDVRCLNILGAVAAYPLLTEIVDHDEQDAGAGLLPGRLRRGT